MCGESRSLQLKALELLIPRSCTRLCIKIGNPAQSGCFINACKDCVNNKQNNNYNRKTSTCNTWRFIARCEKLNVLPQKTGEFLAANCKVVARFAASGNKDFVTLTRRPQETMRIRNTFVRIDQLLHMTLKRPHIA